jgi:hypothetical protein
MLGSGKNAFMRHQLRSTVLSLHILFLVVACNLPTSTPIVVEPSATPSIVSATSTPSTVTPPDLGHIKYSLDTIVDYDRHFITVDETITHPNTSGQALDSLTLAIAANLWPNCFSLKNILVNGIQVSGYALNAHRLDIPLQTPLAPDSVSNVTIRYTLSIPYSDQVNSLRARIFGYSDLQMNLVNWYPFIVPNIKGEWVIRDPWSHGEYLVYPLADFEVSLVFTDPQHAPVVASSGYAESIGEITRYTLTDGRAFTLSASRDFQVSNMQVGDVTVYSYYFPIYKNAGEAALITSAQALQVFSSRFGPYPHKTLSVVVADFSDSMEFSALYFHSRKFYDLYDGTSANYLTYVAVHETGHQWWFDQIANDQALEPWLDESLTTYSESVYYETLYPELVSAWWSNRIDFFRPGGFMDIPVYHAENDDAYKQTVYFNGAHFFKDLRSRIGDEAFFAFLQDYYSQNKGRIATGDDFFRILDEHAGVNYSDIVKAYFRNR